jgi:hypothetical protein
MLEQTVTSPANREERASNDQLTSILSALTALQRGDASVRLPTEWSGLFGKVAEVFNDVVEQN